MIAAIAGVRLVAAAALYTFGDRASPALDLVDAAAARRARLRAPLLARRAHARRHLGSAPTWHDLAFALPLAMLAYTGLETVANLAEETRRARRARCRAASSRRSASSSSSTSRSRSSALSAFPAADGTTALGDEWLRAPLDGDRRRARRRTSGLARDAAAHLRRRSPACSSCSRAATTSISGFGAARVLARRARPAAARVRPPAPADARAPQSIVAAAAISGRARRSRRSALDDGRRLPREPLQLRRPARVHRRAARRDPAPRSRSRTCAARSGCR